MESAACPKLGIAQGFKISGQPLKGYRSAAVVLWTLGQSRTTCRLYAIDTQRAEFACCAILEIEIAPVTVHCCIVWPLPITVQVSCFRGASWRVVEFACFIEDSLHAECGRASPSIWSGRAHWSLGQFDGSEVTF